MDKRGRGGGQRIREGRRKRKVKQRSGGKRREDCEEAKVVNEVKWKGRGRRRRVEYAPLPFHHSRDCARTSPTSNEGPQAWRPPTDARRHCCIAQHAQCRETPTMHHCALRGAFPDPKCEGGGGGRHGQTVVKMTAGCQRLAQQPQMCARACVLQRGRRTPV